jgi:acyl-CoA thioester hydrolase
MGIVHHAAYFTYFEVGRVEWLRRRGVTYADWAARGIHLPVVEAHAHYRSPARFDDLLVLDTTLTQLRSVSLRYAYALRCGTRTVADGWTLLGCVDAAHKLLRIPDDVRAVLTAGESA